VSIRKNARVSQKKRRSWSLLELVQEGKKEEKKRKKLMILKYMRSDQGKRQPPVYSVKGEGKAIGKMREEPRSYLQRCPVEGELDRAFIQASENDTSQECHIWGQKTGGGKERKKRPWLSLSHQKKKCYNGLDVIAHKKPLKKHDPGGGKRKSHHVRRGKKKGRKLAPFFRREKNM